MPKIQIAEDNYFKRYSITFTPDEVAKKMKEVAQSQAELGGGFITGDGFVDKEGSITFSVFRKSNPGTRPDVSPGLDRFAGAREEKADTPTGFHEPSENAAPRTG